MRTFFTTYDSTGRIMRTGMFESDELPLEAHVTPNEKIIAVASNPREDSVDLTTDPPSIKKGGARVASEPAK